MLLDLFITHWTEPWEVGKNGFVMLSLQRAVDWSKIRITLVHDGTEPFPDEYFDGMPFKVNQFRIPHGGIAKARNWCIDHSEATWIKWCDFDDMFAGVYSVQQIMNVLNNDQFDLLWFDLLCDDHGKVINRTERNPVFVHDKVFRRSFLLEKGIRFKEDLTWCEDSAFLALIEMDIDHQRIGKIKAQAPIYLYIVRDGSLCNRPEIKFANLKSFFKRHCYVAEEFKKRGLTAQYNTMCVRTMADSYYTLVKAPDIEEDKKEFAAEVWRWYEDHREAIGDCTKPDFDLVMRAVNRERYDGGEITGEEFIEWIRKHERGEE